MKKIFLASFLIGFYKAQIDSTKISRWKKDGFFGVNASQTALHNWQGGGQENIAISSILNFQITYKIGKLSWLNKLDAQYGIFKIGDLRKFRKSIDQMFFLSQYSLGAWNKILFYSAQVDYRTQFTPGYNYVGDSIIGRATSDFNSPGYIQIALGLDYKPSFYFSIFFAPLAGKITMVNRQYLANAGAYGVAKAEYDSNNIMIRPGRKIRYEFGGRFVMKFKKDIMTNVNLDSYLDLFSNFQRNPQNIDVVFNNLITFKINKFFTATLISQLIYDDDIVIRRDWNKDGNFDNPNDINGPRIQLLTTFGIGIRI